MRETLRGYKSKDGEVMVYKVIANRKMAESGSARSPGQGQIGPLDGFRSKAGQPVQRRPSLQPRDQKSRVRVRRAARRQRRHQDQTSPASSPSQGAGSRFGPRAEIYETPQSYVVRRVENGEDKILSRCSRRILARDIPREQFIKMLETGKTDLLDKFWSQRTRRPFSAFLAIKPDGTTGFEFAPRAPKDPNAPAKGRLEEKAAGGHPGD